jgi:hypothetical protein
MFQNRKAHISFWKNGKNIVQYAEINILIIYEI